MDFSKTARLYHHETNVMSLRSKALMLHYILLYLYMKFTKMTTTFAVLTFMSLINQIMTNNSTGDYTAPLTGNIYCYLSHLPYNLHIRHTITN